MSAPLVAFCRSGTAAASLLRRSFMAALRSIHCCTVSGVAPLPTCRGDVRNEHRSYQRRRHDARQGGVHA